MRPAARTARQQPRVFHTDGSDHFTQAHDDGAVTRDLDKAQVILVGVSRCGKTRHAVSRAAVRHPRANLPLTPDDFVDRKLPHP